MPRSKRKAKKTESKKGYQKPTLHRVELDLKNLAAKMQGPPSPTPPPL